MSVQREIDWAERLPRPIKVKGRRKLLKTRQEAGLFILEELPVERAHRVKWRAAMAALVGGAPIDRVQALVHEALGSDRALG
jgi:hypothetical protein